MAYVIIQCVVCDKQTANGRRPMEGRVRGDGSERYPRRHRGDDGRVCPGVFALGRWIDPVKPD